MDNRRRMVITLDRKDKEDFDCRSAAAVETSSQKGGEI